MTERYLVEINSQSRESEALRFLCETRFLLDELLTALGLAGELYWAMLGVPHGKLVTSREGDVDLLAGPLAFKSPSALEPLRAKFEKAAPRLSSVQHYYFAALQLAAEGGLEWPPSLNHLVAVEAKCAYFDSSTSRVMSQKSSPSKIRNAQTQIEEMLEMLPFNRVALLDVIVNPPAAGEGVQAWVSAAATASNSLQSMLPTLGRRLRSASAAGHFVMPWGAVQGENELSRGTGAPLLLREAKENPRLSEPAVRPRRRELEDNLRQILAGYAAPVSFPAIL